MIGLICLVSHFVFIGMSQVCDCQLCSILFFLCLSLAGCTVMALSVHQNSVAE